MAVGEVVVDQWGNIDRSLTKAVNRSIDRDILMGAPVEKSPMERARELVALCGTQKAGRALLCDKEAYDALRANASVPAAAVIQETVYGIPVYVDASLPKNTVIIGPEPQPAVPAVVATRPKPDHAVMIRKVTEFKTLVHGETYDIDHPFSGPDFIVQVIHVMTGKEVEHLEVIRRASDVRLRWTLHDASPVEQPSISVMVVMIG